MSDEGKHVPHVVYHVACMGNSWLGIVNEQLLMLKESGLADSLYTLGDSVGITHVGPDGSLAVVLECARLHGVPVHVVRSDPNTDHYETFAMMEIDRLAKGQQTNRPIIYMHTKGVTNPSDSLKTSWRRAMGHAVISKWRENVGYLADGGRYDAAGFIWIAQGEQHFTGTFWMARADWIRKLPAFVPYHHAKRLVRYSCELWIGAQAHPTCRAFSHGPVNRFVHTGGFDFTPYLPLPSIAPVVVKPTVRVMNRPAVTWCSAATPDYVADIVGLQTSFGKLGDDHEMITKVLARAGRSPWRHCFKLDAMRSIMPSVETSHVFWIDADCRFLADVPLELLIDANKLLSAVQHFLYSGPAEGLPPRLVGRLPSPARDVYWQACLWGGTVEAVADVLDAVRWISADERGYDEHALNIEFQKRFDQVYTLPCRFAAPETFKALPVGSVESYEQRAGGSPLVHHCNREIRR